MSRVRVQEVSSPISLFPFIGILLCTMGALLVVLVAVSRSTRDTAQRQVQAQQNSAIQPANDGVHKKLEEVNQYVGSLTKVRGEAERKLRDEQLRLGHIEDHMRRLQDRMQSLQQAAIELQGLEAEHYDDRQQAEREIDRLHKLISDSQKNVDAMREEAGKEAHSYAVVPYEGPNGTFRRPIYIECIKNELIVQPEGIHIKMDDLRPPLGPGNPLASVLRASRDQMIRINPKIGQSRDTEPYPLLLVRPDGLYIYDRARQAIEAGDFDLGFELVESDWKLKFPQSDPQLAGIEQQALELARARQQQLVAAAPRAYGGGSVAAAGGFDDDEDDGDGGSGDSGSTGSGGGGPAGSGRGASSTYTVRSNKRGSSEENGEGGGPDNAGSGEAMDSGKNGIAGASGSSNGTPSIGGASAGAGDGVTKSEGQPTSNAVGGNQITATGSAGGPGSIGGGGGGNAGPSASPADKNLVPDGYEQQQSRSVAAGDAGSSDSMPPGAASAPQTERERAALAENRGKDWALRQKPARAVAVRRTIHVTVRKDQLAVLPDTAPSTTAGGGKAIPIKGDTVELVDELVKEVRDHIDGWGIAGNGLYWRPVILLNVDAGGQQRADDLTRLLKNSGLEIRTEETAKNLPQGAGHETR